MIIKFDKSIYHEQAITQAICDYKSIATIESYDIPGFCVCIIKTSKYLMDKTALEFSNYVLNLSIMREKEL